MIASLRLFLIIIHWKYKHCIVDYVSAKLQISKNIKAWTDVIKSYDMFGSDIKFTYKGSEKFNTFIGGLVSLGITAVMIAYTYSLINTMINYGDSLKSTNRLVRNLVRNDNALLLNQTDFSFAFSIK